MDSQIKTKTKLTNGNQYNRLVKFMLENPKLAAYTMIKTAKEKLDYNKRWDEISKQLNMMGPPMRTMDEWKKVWKDYKYHIKKKCYIKQKQEQTSSEDRPAVMCRKVHFNDNELAIIKSLKLETLVPRCKKIINNGLPEYVESNAINDETDNPPVIETELSEMVFNISKVTGGVDFIDTNSSSACYQTNPDKKEKSPEVERDAIDVEDQFEIEKQIRKLKKEKVNILRQTSELNKRHLELKTKIYKLKERKFEMKCKQFNDEYKYKTQILELKERELELKEAENFPKEIKLEIEN